MLSVYTETYSAIANGGRRPRWRLRRAVGRLVVTLAIVAFFSAIRTMRPETATSAISVIRTTAPQLVAWLTTVTVDSSAMRSLRTSSATYAPEALQTTPARPKAALRVGDEQAFAVEAIGPELHYYAWTLDGVPAGTGPWWTFAARPGDLGLHRVEVVVTGGAGAQHRSWTVLVRRGRPPHVVTDPPPGTLQVANESPLRFMVTAEPAAHDEHVTLTTWSVDGAPAGQGDTLTLPTDEAGTRTVVARVFTDLGASATCEWQVTVRPVAAPVLAERPREPATERELGRSTSHSVERAAAPAPLTGKTDAAGSRAHTLDSQPVARKPERPAATGRVAHLASLPRHDFASEPPELLARDEEIRRWLERYAAALSAHDVETLRHMGAVSEGEVDAARRSRHEGRARRRGGRHRPSSRR